MLGTSLEVSLLGDLRERRVSLGFDTLPSTPSAEERIVESDTHSASISVFFLRNSPKPFFKASNPTFPLHPTQRSTA